MKEEQNIHISFFYHFFLLEKEDIGFVCLFVNKEISALVSYGYREKGRRGGAGACRGGS